MTRVDAPADAARAQPGRAFPAPLVAVWFDLDGTLVDSAPDLHAAAVALCAEEGTTAPDLATFRRVVSRGGQAMLEATFGTLADATRRAALLERFLTLYAGREDADTHVFPGLAAILDALEARGLRWGVVTNKAGALAEPLLQRLGLFARASACVYGDTLPVRKPDPEPLLHACARAGVPVGGSIYVGDDLRDVQAARAAGMYSVAVGWGYLNGDDPRSWGADAFAAGVADLGQLLER